MSSLHQKLDLMIHPELLLQSLGGEDKIYPDLLQACLVWMQHPMLLPKVSVGTLGEKPNGSDHRIMNP